MILKIKIRSLDGEMKFVITPVSNNFSFKTTYFILYKIV